MVGYIPKKYPLRISETIRRKRYILYLEKQDVDEQGATELSSYWLDEANLGRLRYSDSESVW